jgi:hypothetical protein
MNNFRIFTESPADVKFLKDYIATIINKELLTSDFDVLGGWAGYKTGGSLNPAIQQNADNGNLSILILDADKDFKARFNEIRSDFDQYKVPIELFLFPNHAHLGNLETLLTEIAVDKKLIDCFLQYEKCIEGYNKPVNKSKIFAYLDALLPEKNKKGSKGDLIQEVNRDYKNKLHWDLSHKYLDPLKEFLATHLK